ncbi:hypothetical protein K505DRAFT_320324 [Melanomma pulvis-pyrius CBS 109.77]|uniref:Uncharacterized protein n=1 Tax=Melanomma pulvis-pyrius CBS 109.77 TaxID=1314802 RepID=A0A6A6XVZ2_9PLEO|nr:hypothetical protein K505DRAFT_320324 [Melanomma pulvis-pyrius CBS 109.77]
MAPRRVTPAGSSEDLDRSYPESSPDPLNGSITANKPRRKPARTSKAPLASSSPSKQNRRPSIAEQVLEEFSSPSKSMVLSTGRPGGASPWRIKVTVEAEPGSDSNMESPLVKRLTRTKTTTVPLKDPDASSPVKRLGRPRKSEAATSAKPKRSGTPVRKGPQSQGRRSSVGAADVDTTDSAPKKRAGRPRKSIQPALEDSEMLAESEDPLQETSLMDATTMSVADADTTEGAPKARGGRLRNKQPTIQDKETSTESKKQDKETSSIYAGAISETQEAKVSNTAPKKRRGRPRKSQLANEETGILDVIEDLIDTNSTTSVKSQTKLPDFQATIATLEPTPQFAVPVIQTTLATPQEPQPKSISGPPLKSISLLQPKEMARKHKLIEYDEPTVFTPPDTDLSRRLRARKDTPAAKGIIILSDSSDEDSSISTPSGTDEEAGVDEVQREDPLLDAVIRSEETRLIQAIDDDEDNDDELQDVTNFAFDEGATRMADDTTILESENFSMVSVDSLPSSSGHSSPPIENASRSTAVENIDSVLDQSYLQLPPLASRKTRSSPRQLAKSPSETSYVAPVTYQMRSSPPVPPRREHTPSIDSRCPSNPPAIVPAHFSPSKAELPKLGRVVKAGVALQGVLDPNRITPTTQSSKRALGKQRDALDDLFRGFSEGTRRELQAGLRLGEQLAQQKHASRESSPALSSPCKVAIPAESSDDVFCPQAKHRLSRLLTPEDQADYTLPLPPAPTGNNEVQYPTLRANEQDSQLISPARSDDEMSWRADTPPVSEITADGRGFVTAINEQGEEVRGTKIYIIAEEEQEDYSDIWQEEASRSSESLAAEDTASESTSEKTPHLQDLFTNDSLIKPARGKLPKTWRRKSSSNFNYSDEAEPEPEQLVSPLSTESHDSVPTKMDKGKGKVVEPPTVEEQYLDYEDDEFSEASDDTGMFFHSNLPNVFDNKRKAEKKVQKPEDVDMSMLLGDGQSLVPESSPTADVMKTPSKQNPFKNTPLRFVALQTSPVKSSPLRQEMRVSDSEESYQQGLEESSILPASSPFRTMVDDGSMTMCSDAQQFRAEMEGQTNSSIRHLRNEADDYLDAYEPQERTLEEIQEVTEPSRTYQSTMLPSSPPQAIEASILAPKRAYAPLFEDAMSATTSSSNARNSSTVAPEKRPTRKPTSIPVIAKAPSAKEVPQTSLFTRLTSSLWGALGTPAPPALHPVARKFDALPKVEPWTKTHYKTLDALFQLHKKQPTLFAPSASSSTSNTNNALLAWFQGLYEKKGCKFVGARFSSWGYNVTLTESLVILCAVYMQLLTRNDIADYEEGSGKQIQMGDCGPGVAGTMIDGNEVVRRLTSVIMGEQLRRDEREGREIKREGAMTVVWPK